MTARTVILLRHAEAGPPEPGQGDIDRALTRQGRTQADQVNRWLQQHPEWRGIEVRVSPAKRTRETADRALAGWHRGEVVEDRRLWNASLDTLFDLLGERTGDLLLIGHNPGLEQLSRAWTGMLMPVSVGSAHVLTIDDDGRARAADRFQPSRDAT
ncbi:histidine phosphatase family protein [Wenzhouxiangella sp. XN79A]|uniref:SixA phosphatase family protein n=1 Tax=Wenzhouxiangella sp. XN79A TaxID=2724193 RepID=UPI00144AB72F|nr:histidine phosphatase family protein [Wenzhouxiangella sp. XN79A]NKI35298.1 histidine phosphatase family protein [Wenzhouxiangella sp. XN79A]